MCCRRGCIKGTWQHLAVRYSHLLWASLFPFSCCRADRNGCVWRRSSHRLRPASVRRTPSMRSACPSAWPTSELRTWKSIRAAWRGTRAAGMVLRRTACVCLGCAASLAWQHAPAALYSTMGPCCPLRAGCSGCTCIACLQLCLIIATSHCKFSTWQCACRQMPKGN